MTAHALRLPARSMLMQTWTRAVDINDLSRILTNYDRTGVNWQEGDFNYDGSANINDLSRVLTNYDKAVNPSRRVWCGGSAYDSNWSTPANWADGETPVSGDSLVFSGGQRTATFDDLRDGTRFQSIEFHDNNFSVSAPAGNCFTVTGGIKVDSGVTGSEITAGVALAGGLPLTSKAVRWNAPGPSPAPAPWSRAARARSSFRQPTPIWAALRSVPASSTSTAERSAPVPLRITRGWR